MKKYKIFLVIFAILCFVASVLTATEDEECIKDLSKVQPGRKCRKSCTSHKGCKGANKGCHCDDVCGMSCFNPNSECPDPTATFENGEVLGDSYVVGSVIEYLCGEGFILNGNSTRSCHADRNWAGKEPVCELACSVPPRDAIAFHTLIGGGFPVGTKTKYECRFGYKISGNPEIECLEDYSWSEPYFSCVKLSCPVPVPPANGYIEGSDFSFGSWITYHCEKGFVIDNPDRTRRYCSSTGTWSAESRTCSKIKCPPPTKPENGFVTSHGEIYEFRSIVTYYCESGYDMVGSSKGECNEDGNWGAVPTCTVDVNCNFDGLSNPLCGYTNEGEGKFERQFIQENTLSGKPTYVLRATTKPAVLLSPSLLTGESYCFKFHYYIRYLADSRNFAVSSGQNVIGKIRVKEKKNRWLNQQVTVKPHEIFGTSQFDITIKRKNTKIDLDDFSLATGECVSNCKADTCLNDGICIDRIGTYTCICTRYFRGDNCEIEILCPSVPEIPFGTAVIKPDPDRLGVGTKVSYFCNDGYLHVSGPKSIVCTEKGAWSIKKNPICQEILCPRVRKPRGGSMEIYSVDGDKTKMKIGTIVKFSCPLQKYLKDLPTTIVCLRSGKWSGSYGGTCEDKQPSFDDCPLLYRKRGPVCYKENRKITTYDEAVSKCAQNDAMLSVIRSEDKRTRLSNIVSRNILYHVGLDDIGRRSMRWTNGAIFKKNSGIEYTGNFDVKDDVTDEFRCATFKSDIGRFEISTSPCTRRRRYMCEALPVSATAINVQSENEDLSELNGIYRPLIGVIYTDSLVYEKDSKPKFYLYRWKKFYSSGWAIGEFDIKMSNSVPKRDVVKVGSVKTLPQLLDEQWTKGSVFGVFEGANVTVKTDSYDQWKEWSGWSPCTRTCGGGFSLRTRNCTEVGGAAGYGDCRGRNLETIKCGQKQCIITRWSEWRKWSKCSKPCGVGNQTRNRTCIKDPLSLEVCKGSSVDERPCNEQDCLSSTSEWQRNDKLEYKIIDQTSFSFIAKEDCENFGGKLAKVNSLKSLSFLVKQIKSTHCRSNKAFLNWHLWSTYVDINAIVRNKNNASSDLDIKDIKKSEVAKNCHSIRHSCDAPGIHWEISDCKEFEASGYICQRVWKPCNNNSCNNGTCKNLDGEQYECTCDKNFEGDNCEIALQCNIEQLSKNYKVTYASTMEPVNETYVWKNEEIHLACKRKGQATTDDQVFKCVGLNQWNVKRPAIDCGKRCLLPELESGITATYEGKEVSPGEEFAPGVLLVFKCPELMRIVGEPLAACDKDGWDVTLPTECEFTFPCRKVDNPLNGKLDIHPKFQEGDTFKTGTKITLECDSGFVLWGEKEINCDKNGHWSSKLGECKNVPGCELRVDELRPEVTPFDLKGQIKQNSLFPVDETIYLRCAAKGKKATIKGIKCIANRKWNMEISTYCK